VAHVPSYLADALRFGYLTAWRRGAVRSLEWRDVNLRARTLTLRAVAAKNCKFSLSMCHGLAGVLVENAPSAS